MLHRVIVLGVLLLLEFSVQAQQNYYWIKFKDKGCSQSLLANPSQFLSNKSLTRRQNQNISVGENDLPLCKDYLDSIAPYVTFLKHRLKWFNMAVVQVNVPSNIDSIRAFSFVDSIGGIEYLPYKSKMEKYESISLLPDQSIVYPNNYGAGYHQLRMLNADLLHQLGFAGEGKMIAVFDNGFNNVNIIPGFDSVRSRILNTYDFVQNEEFVYEDGGHGTSVLSCIAGNIPGKMVGTAPNSDYLLLETEDDNAEWIMEEYNWAAGAEYADSIGADIFSTSLGYTTFDGDSGDHTYTDLNGDLTVITRAGNLAFSKGILVLNSAGNYGQNSWGYIGAPADGNDVMAIGAVDSAEKVAAFSSRGPNSAGRIKPDFCAQGVNTGVITTGGSVGTSGGTSFSCPVLAGCAACLWQAFPEKTNREIFDAIAISADRFWTPDNEYGYGIPNFYNAYLLLKTDYNGNILKVDDKVSVYPNPFKNEFFASVYADANREYLIEVFNMNGQLVFSKNAYVRKHTFEIFNLSEATTLPDGKYLLRLNRDKSSTVTIIKIN